MAFDTPILLLTFTRLDTTIKVFEQIKKQKPRKLYWASDGPRKGKPEDIQKIESVRKYIFSQIDWDCDVKTLFRDQNLGCGLAVSGAITWFFDNVEQGIILEDDCVPQPGFFSFCEEMLNYYKDDEQIYEVSGTNLQANHIRGNASYYFSNYGGIWGWATWARAWKMYDFEMTGLEEFVKKERIKYIFSNKQEQQYWLKTLNEALNVDTWDYQWVFTFWQNNGICIVPNKNLIENIGFDKEGTHTLTEPVWYKKLKSSYVADDILFPIRHPENAILSKRADKYLFKHTMKVPFIEKLKSNLKGLLKVN